MPNGVVTISLAPAVMHCDQGLIAAAPRGRSSAAKPAASREEALPFVAGPENAIAATAVESLLEAERSAYNPLVICGPPGCGKSRLARGLAQHYRLKQRGEVYCSTGADFAREFAGAIEDGSIVDARARWRAAALFVLEDLTQLTTKPAAQTELMCAVDVLLAEGAQVIITSRLAPAQIDALLPGLAGRLSAGLLAPLAFPGPAARLQLLEHFATSRRVTLAPAAAKLLADSLDGSVPELLGAIVELSMPSAESISDQAAVDKLPATKTFAEKGTTPTVITEITAVAARRYLAERANRLQPSLRGIATVTAKHFGLKVAELKSPSRRRGIVLARGVAMYLGRQLTGKSLEELGEYFGGRDHTTVLHSYRSTDDRLRSDPELRRAVADLRKALATV